MALRVTLRPLPLQVGKQPFLGLFVVVADETRAVVNFLHSLSVLALTRFLKSYLGTRLYFGQDRSVSFDR